jgi:hypothetical protein
MKSQLINCLFCLSQMRLSRLGTQLRLGLSRRLLSTKTKPTTFSTLTDAVKFLNLGSKQVSRSMLNEYQRDIRYAIDAFTTHSWLNRRMSVPYLKTMDQHFQRVFDALPSGDDRYWCSKPNPFATEYQIQTTRGCAELNVCPRLVCDRLNHWHTTIRKKKQKWLFGVLAIGGLTGLCGQWGAQEYEAYKKEQKSKKKCRQS